MCGIVGYLGDRDAYAVILKGLKRLEYRGYDSAGIALGRTTDFEILKQKGKVSNLEGRDLEAAQLGIGHTRWATHGEPSDLNSHPHLSNSGELVIVHNGIIENYDTIKEELIHRGYTFSSDTDTEVLVNLIEDVKNTENISLAKAVELALNQVVGAYAICILDKNTPEEMVVARLGSPLVVGVGEGEYFVASDASPFVEYTKEAVYLEDGEMAVLKQGEDMHISKIENGKTIDAYIQTLQLNLEEIEKGGFDHFMLKEIYEQPDALRDTLRGRLKLDEAIITIDGLNEHRNKFLNAHRIIIVACGTSWHAGLVAEYLIEEFARIPVEVEYASEFRYRNPILGENDVVIPISQSGETADTLAAIKLAKSKGAFVWAVCNVVGSSIAREAHAGAYTHAGPEIGVASTKAFTTQVAVFTMLALELGHNKGLIPERRFHSLLNELANIPSLVEKVLEKDELINAIADQYRNSSNFLYLGRGYNFPVALEGALKLKEISYVHAEGYPAAEMKHGPIALIDAMMPVVVIAPRKGRYEKVLSNVQEIKTRKGRIIAVVTKGDETIAELADYTIEIPEVSDEFSPLITTIPLQLLSYHIALKRGCNVDQPRNLAKSVTVE